MSAATLPEPVRRKEPKVRYNEFGDVILPRGAEFVDGRIVFKRRQRGSAMSELSNWVGNELMMRMALHVNTLKSGVVFRGAEEQGYCCFPHKPKQVRKPDVSFVRRDMSKFFLRDTGWTLEVPELVVEVMSPEDRRFDIESRVADFLAAGTKLVWLIDPVLESAEVVHADGIKYPVRRTGYLDGEDVLPGFRLPLADVLPPKPPQ